MSRKQSVRTRPGKKAEVERKRDERAARRALAKERRNRAGDDDGSEEFASFANQLQVLGLRLREVPGDGNCLFRALGDQLEGHSRNHLRLRQETVNYMVKHRGDFEPFVEDDIPFDRHVSNLAQSGTFAGNDAIVAFARSSSVNVVIHQLNNPLWQIRGSDKPNVRELHIAYRYGEHYDSVRRINDNTETPANVQTEMLSKDESNRKGKQKSSLPNERSARQGDAVQKVQNATGCTDARLILQSLEAESYDIESAIHVILQIQELKQIAGNAGSADEGCQCPHTNVSLDSDDRERTRTQRRPEYTENCSPVSTVLSNHSRQTRPDANIAPPEEDCAEDKNTQEENRDRRSQKVSNKQRKDQQRQQKKKRQEERHRQKVQDLRSNNTDNNQQEDSDPSRVTVIKAFEALNI
ncbi:OTU domain-containing protein 3 isoform X2 [Pseudophryne corroboree]|uniref:OTU domain-containing protein 3 isoform X2 n=1 Tax=Pseudophryne corroboree TaxID=495146 RepID=UPI003081F99C